MNQAATPSQVIPLSVSTADLLIRRREEGSKPGNRRDGRFVSLVIEGGAMRGVVSAGMVAALEHLNLRDSFDAVYGSSAGAVTGAYFVAGQARYGTTIFYDNINNKQFIDLKRIFSNKPVVSLEFLLDEVCVNQKKLDFARVMSSDVPLYIVAASVINHRSVIISDYADQRELLTAMKASARIPFFAGGPVRFRDDLLLDASLYESIPFRAAQDNGKTTDMVVLLTRPAGNLRSDPGLIDKIFVAPYLRSIDPSIARHYLERAAEYEKEIKSIQSFNGSGSLQALPVQIDAEAEKVSSFEMSRSKLTAAAMSGFRAVYKALGLEQPKLLEIITPQPDPR